jgi:hypothetical protein
VSKGARFWSFRGSRVRGVLGGISSIPLDLTSFGGQNLGYRHPMRCSYYPQSLTQISGAIWEIGSRIWGSSPTGAIHPESPGHTGLTGASHRSNRCRPQLGFCSSERLGEFVVVPCCCCFEFGSFWSSVGLFGILGLLAWTDLTGVLHRPDWCKGCSVEVASFHQQGPV